MTHKYYFGYSRKFSEKWLAMKKRQAVSEMVCPNCGHNYMSKKKDDLWRCFNCAAPVDWKAYEYPKIDTLEALGVPIDDIQE